ncbi:MAG: tetratricopeptide repeat protein [Chthonomonadaceae bacterium]|nr:tetratricopeptide repeat protein [Chthonomonadaceae bacterium]
MVAPKTCRVEMLGQLKVVTTTGSTTRFRTYKTGALLSYLAFYLDRPVPREELVEMLWPESGSDQARNSLSQSLSSLRHLLEPPPVQAGAALEAGRHTVRLKSEACDTDVVEFRTLAKLADQAKVTGDLDLWQVRAMSAVESFPGEFLPGIYEDWCLGHREGLREEALSLIEALSADFESKGDLKIALKYAIQGVSVDVTRESCHRAAIRLYDKLGQPDSAVKQFRILEKALSSQLGIRPASATKQMARDALDRPRSETVGMSDEPSQAEVLGTPTWIDCLSCLNLADIQIEDAPKLPSTRRAMFASPEAALLFAHAILKEDPLARTAISTGNAQRVLDAELVSNGQIVCDEATALLCPIGWVDLGLRRTNLGNVRLYVAEKTAGAPVAPHAGLSTIPRMINSTFGRETEVRQIVTLLTSGAQALVTVTGPGGMGKTRLTIECASRMVDDHSCSVVFVPLETAINADQTWSALAKSLKLVTTPKLPTSEQVLSALQSRSCVLILDNFEQLVDSGGKTVVSEILQLGSGTTLLISSRRSLGIDGEVAVSLGPLSTDSNGSTQSNSAAVELFVDRATAVKPDFQLSDTNRETVYELCRRLEGVPLAIELAAARIQVLSPKQILERFDERLDLLSSRTKPARHKSLRDAIDGTYHMLDPVLQRAFRNLTVFRDGWSEELAESVLDTPVALDTLAELVDFSLVQTTETKGGQVRFSMLDTLREYSAAVSPPDELAECRKRMAQGVTRLVETSERLLEGPRQVAVLDKLELERSNIAEALAWAIENEELETMLRICGASWRFWHLKSHLLEGRRWCSTALELGEGPNPLRAKVLNAWGRLAYLQGDYDEAKKAHESALEISTDDSDSQAMALNALGAVAYEQGRYDESVGLFEQALELRRERGDRFGEGNALSWLGIVFTDQCKYDLASEFLQQSLSIRQDIGDLGGIARSLNSLGILARRQVDLESATSYYEEALGLHQQLGDRRAIAGMLANLGIVAQLQGQLDKATSLLEESHSICDEIGDKWGSATARANLANLALESGDPSKAKSLHAGALRDRFGLNNMWGVAYSLEGSARALVSTKKYEAARIALTCAGLIRDGLGLPLPPSEQALVKETWRTVEEKTKTGNGGVLQTADAVEHVLRALEQ